MAPDERRDVLVGVFLDLARQYGRVPSTSEIARAAGVAEGTIFRAFGTKDALQTDAVQVAFCPVPVRREFRAIDLDQPMRDRLVAFTAILQRRFRDVFGLMAALGLTQPPNIGAHTACFEAGRHVRTDIDAESCEPMPLGDLAPLLDLVDPDQLIVSPDALLHRIRLLTFSGSHDGITDGTLLTPEEIVDTILDGVRARPAP